MSTIDLSSAASLADVAAALQTALRAATNANLTNSTVVYNAVGRRFEIDNGVSGSSSTLTVATAPSAGTDISTLVGWTADAGAIVDNGVDAETIEEALQAIQDLNDQWYFLLLEQPLNDTQTVLDASTWVATRDYMFFAESNDVGALVTGETASTFAQLAALRPERTVGDWTPASDKYLSVSSASRLSSVNFDGANTLINPKFKSRPGIEAATLTATQRVELDRKLVNYFTTFGTDAIYVEGWTFRPGVFQDVRYWLDWLVNAVRVDTYNFLRQSDRVPQTTPGHVATQRVITLACQQGVTNGGAAPGQLSPALTLDIQQVTGNEAFDGFLPRGYFVHFGPVAEQPQAVRATRASTAFRVWIKGSGAINSIDIAITFEN